VKVRGLRVVVAGECFGPIQVGTQVATEHTIRALAAHADVAEVIVVVPGPVPDYAAETLTGKKVRALTVRSDDLRAYQPDLTDMDIVFRPFQPTSGWDAGIWRLIGRRLVISVLDTIAFHNGGYFASSVEWLAYRENLRSCVGVADAVTVISDDVITQMRLHAFPIGDTRLHSIPLGTEHLDGGDATSLPCELLARGFTTGAFALCLGVNYTHKNREIALAAHELVRAAGHELALVLAGASVPHGSTRLAEARHGSREHVFVLPEVAAAEKNWLLRHASFVWYPTSAEGFGLVPFEAAANGTPTVAVDFGPLHELLIGNSTRERLHGGDVPLLASDWTASSLADVACRFLDDPDLARRHCDAVLEAGGLYSWERTASSLVGLFRDVLAMPRR
jgi:glycosyltransferase involved in cell wall biosynthesis